MPELYDMDQLLPAAARYDRWCRLAYEHYSVRAALYKPVEVHVFWGAPGTGKTRAALEHCTYRMCMQPKLPSWWDGYISGNVVLDDFADSQLSISGLLTITDSYQVRLPVKGGHVYSKWDKLYITSNIDPREWYKGVNMARRTALADRITSVTHYAGPSQRGQRAYDPTPDTTNNQFPFNFTAQ